MAGKVWIILKKIFSLALIFNALITIAVVVGILFGFYRAYPDWKPFCAILDRREFVLGCNCSGYD